MDGQQIAIPDKKKPILSNENEKVVKRKFEFPLANRNSLQTEEPKSIAASPPALPESAFSDVSQESTSTSETSSKSSSESSTSSSESSKSSEPSSWDGNNPASNANNPSLTAAVLGTNLLATFPNMSEANSFLEKNFPVRVPIQSHPEMARSSSSGVTYTTFKPLSGTSSSTVVSPAPSKPRTPLIRNRTMLVPASKMVSRFPGVKLSATTPGFVRMANGNLLRCSLVGTPTQVVSPTGEVRTVTRFTAKSVEEESSKTTVNAALASKVTANTTPTAKVAFNYVPAGNFAVSNAPSGTVAVNVVQAGNAAVSAAQSSKAIANAATTGTVGVNLVHPSNVSSSQAGKVVVNLVQSGNITVNTPQAGNVAIDASLTSQNPTALTPIRIARFITSPSQPRMIGPSGPSRFPSPTNIQIRPAASPAVRPVRAILPRHDSVATVRLKRRADVIVPRDTGYATVISPTPVQPGQPTTTASDAKVVYNGVVITKPDAPKTETLKTIICDRNVTNLKPILPEKSPLQTPEQ